MPVETDGYLEPLAYYLQLRREQGLSPRWAYTAVLQRYARNAQDYQARYRDTAVWLKKRDARLFVEAVATLRDARERKTEGLTAVADYCRDNGYGAARRDKLGLVAQ